MNMMTNTPNGWLWSKGSPLASPECSQDCTVVGDSSYPTQSCPLPFTGVRLCLLLPFVIHKDSQQIFFSFNPIQHLFLRKLTLIWVSVEQFTDFSEDVISKTRRCCPGIEPGGCDLHMGTVPKGSWRRPDGVQVPLLPPNKPKETFQV